MKQNISILLRVLFTVPVILLIVLIFLNSIQTGEVSAGKSVALTQLINEGFERLGTGIRITEHSIRKLAHFAEFTLLGFFTIPMLRAYTHRIIFHLSWPLLVGIIVPILDESLQLLVSGRSGQLTDILIDLSGSFTGILIGLLLLRITRRWWNSLYSTINHQLKTEGAR